jgi:hypothetical protein
MYEWKAGVEDVYFDFNCVNKLYAGVDVVVELGSLRVIKFFPPWCITHMVSDALICFLF